MFVDLVTTRATNLFFLYRTNSKFSSQVTDPQLLVEYPPTQHAHGLLSSALGLRVPVGRTMQVRCTARVAPAWREGSEAVVGNSQLADSKEAMLLGKLT